MSGGRKDYQVKIQGHKVELGEIEQHVRNFTKTVNTCALSFIDETGFTAIHLFAEKNHFNSDDILQYLKSKVPGYMIPSGVTMLEAFPVNQNGKIDRIALSKMM
jgi:acyl-coenzyme A synthetase/AMP-(fatty) acid ligase